MENQMVKDDDGEQWSPFFEAIRMERKERKILETIENNLFFPPRSS
jgi:hypothetical protein